jgi:YYY domain-containing protein
VHEDRPTSSRVAIRKRSAVSARRLVNVLSIILVLGSALLLRLHGLDWDQGYLLHPDERFQLMVAVDRIRTPERLADLFDPTRSPWNPRSAGPDGRPQAFAYGALPLYLLESISWFTDRLLHAVGIEPGTARNLYHALAFRGRFLTVLIDVVGLIFALLIARRAFGRAAASMAGLLVGLSIITIQQAHFFVVDPWATSFGIATLWATTHLAETGSRRWAALAGAFYAAALACKVSMWPLAVPIGIALVWYSSRTAFDCTRPVLTNLLRNLVTRTPWPVLLASTFIAFAVFEPYTLLDPRSTLRDIVREWEIAQGRLDVPYTRQYVGTVPIVYQIEQLFRWGLGPAFAALSALAIVRDTRKLLVEIISHRLRVSATDGHASIEGQRAFVTRLLLLSWILAYGLTAWTAETKYLRYSLPLVAPLAILVAATLSEWLERSSSRWQRAGASFALLLVLGVTAAWAGAFSTIYRHPHTRVEASEWIVSHIPPGAVLGVEHWDDRLPLAVSGISPDQRYRFVTLALYDDRSPEEAFGYLAARLSKVDYIVLSSDRLAGSIPRLPWRYPVTSEYYRLLDQGALGFRLIYEAKRESRLGPLRLDDLEADESFTVYDHPRVRIYQKVRQLSEDELRLRFAWALQRPWYPQRDRPEAYRQLLDGPAESAEVARDLGWAEEWLARDWEAIVWWVALSIAIGAVGLPLATRLGAPLPDAGLALARPLGLIVLAYPIWLAASWRILPFELPWLLLPMVSVAVLLWWRWGHRLRALVRPCAIRCAILVEGSFWFGFAFFLVLRWLYPDLWHPFFGGEKPMELAYANAIARSRWLPPYDPWLADGVQNYYYYGFFLNALQWKLSGLLPDRALQLTVATFAGLVASLAVSLGLALVHWLVDSASSTSWRGRTLVTSLASGMGSLWWLLFAGNLDPIIQVITKRSLAIDFWQSSRAIAQAITEFPYFSFLYADLHPHLIALPFWLSLIALIMAAHAEQEAPVRDRALRWMTSVLVGSTVIVVNSWDLPLVALLLIAMTLVTIVPRRPAQLVWVVGASILALAASRLIYWPFYERFVSPVTSLRLLENGTAPDQFLVHFGLLLALPVLAVVANWSLPARSFWSLGLIAVGATAIGYAVGLMLRSNGWSQVGLSASDAWILLLLLSVFLGVPFGCSLAGFDPLRPETLWCVALLGAAVGLFGTRYLAASLLVVPTVLVSAWLVQHWRDRRAPLLGLWVVAAGIVMLMETVVIVDDLYGSPWQRMNTVFKLSFEAWPLLALSGWGLCIDRWHAQPKMRTRARTFAQLVLVGVIGISSLYLLLGTPQRLALRLPSTPQPGSLDGYAWMRGGFYFTSRGEPIGTSEDLAVIQWLRQNLLDNSVILEASIGPYRGNGSRLSSATGLPTVLGWDRHERQQRTRVIPIDRTIRLESPLGPTVDERLIAIREIYQTTDPARKRWLLYQYRVRYVVVGQVERRWRIQPGFAGATIPDEVYASPEGIAAFEPLIGNTLRVAVTFGDTVIYEVVPLSER